MKREMTVEDAYKMYGEKKVFINTNDLDKDEYLEGMIFRDPGYNSYFFFHDTPVRSGSNPSSSSYLRNAGYRYSWGLTPGANVRIKGLIDEDHESPEAVVIVKGTTYLVKRDQLPQIIRDNTAGEIKIYEITKQVKPTFKFNLVDAD